MAHGPDSDLGNVIRSIPAVVYQAEKLGYNIALVRKNLESANESIALKRALDTMHSYAITHAIDLYPLLLKQDVLLRCCPVTGIVKVDNDPFLDERYLVTGVLKLTPEPMPESDLPTGELLVMVLTPFDTRGRAPLQKGVRTAVARRMAVSPDIIFNTVLDIAIAVDYP